MLDADAVINNSSQKVGGSNAYPDPAPKKWVGPDPEKTRRIYAPRRRFIADLFITYRIIFGLVDVCMCDYFQQSADGDRTVSRGNPFKLSVDYCRTNTRKKLFSEHAVKVWNSLPPSIMIFFHWQHLEIP